MLEITLANEFVPGSNLAGGTTAACWPLVLPTIELGSVVCLGAPEPATLRTLARIAARVTVCDRPATLAKRALRLASASLPNVATLPWDQDGHGLSDGCADLVVVGRERASQMRAENGWPEAVTRLLKPTGCIYGEMRGDPPSFANGAAPRDPGDRVAEQMLRLLPERGEVEAVLPHEDREVLAFLDERGLVPQTQRRASFSRPSWWWPRGERRHGRLLAPGRRSAAGSPPEYVCEVGRACGVDLAGFRWALVAPGKYASRKAVLFLFPPQAALPRYVVKMTRDPAMNGRLRNERVALEALAQMGIAAVPRVVFAGNHAGLEIVGETAVDGLPMRARTAGRPDCPLAARALAFIAELGATTRTRAVVPSELAASLELLLSRFVELYAPAPAERRFLGEQIEAIARAGQSLPLVFQHGDPGLWNLLATAGDQVAFLDWEAAEPAGVPLWDLFYFFRSFCMASVTVRGRRARMAALVRRLLETGPLHAALVAAVARYRERVGISADMVLPLFITCWMHRALKEATRLPASRLHTGQYVGLLRHCIEHSRNGALGALSKP